MLRLKACFLTTEGKDASAVLVSWENRTHLFVETLLERNGISTSIGSGGATSGEETGEKSKCRNNGDGVRLTSSISKAAAANSSSFRRTYENGLKCYKFIIRNCCAYLLLLPHLCQLNYVLLILLLHFLISGQSFCYLEINLGNLSINKSNFLHCNHKKLLVCISVLHQNLPSESCSKARSRSSFISFCQASLAALSLLAVSSILGNTSYLRSRNIGRSLWEKIMFVITVKGLKTIYKFLTFLR